MDRILEAQRVPIQLHGLFRISLAPIWGIVNIAAVFWLLLEYDTNVYIGLFLL